MTESLCWMCDNAVPDYYGKGCSWSRCGKPVEGWTAVRRDMEGWRLDRNPIESFCVQKCPKFVMDDHAKKWLESRRKGVDERRAEALKRDRDKARLKRYNGGQYVKRQHSIYRGGNGFQIQRCLLSLSQEIAAELIGVPKAMLARVETGDLRYTGSYLYVRTARVYGCSIDDLKRTEPTEKEWKKLLRK